MSSRAPPASPALIMLMYRRLKTLGDLAIASERVEPDSISSHTSVRAYLRRAGLGLHFQNAEAAQDGQAGVLQNGQLPGEGRHDLAAGAAEREAFLLFARALLARAAASLFDRDAGNEVAHLPNSGQGFVFGLRFDHVLDGVAHRVASFELKGWHGAPASERGWSCVGPSRVVRGA